MSVIGMFVLTMIALAALFGLCALAIWFQRENPGEKYDERQKAARGDGYRLAFWTGVIYYLVITLVIGFEGLDSDTAVSLIIIGVLIQAMALHFYGFLTHSTLPLGEKPTLSIICYSIMGIMDLVQFFMLDHRLWHLLVYGCCFLAIALMHVLSLLRKEEE